MSESGKDSVTSLAKRQDFGLGNAIIRPSLRKVDGPNGSTVIAPKVMHALLALVDAQNRVLGRDELLEKCWNGLVVGDDAINRVIAEVRRMISATGANFVVETIPRVGYRLSGFDADETSDASPRWLDFVLNRRGLIVGGVASATIATVVGGTALIHGNDAEVDDLIAQARELQASGTPNSATKAERLLRLAVERDPSRPDAFGWLARITSDSNKAREAALEALRLDPSEPNARVVLIVQRRDLDDWTDWESELLQVLDDAPANTLALSHLTHFYQGLGRCTDSWVMNERTLAAEKFNIGAHHRKALKHWIFGRLSDANKVADQSLRLWPRNPVIWNTRLTIYAFTNRATAALALLEDAAGRPGNLTQPSIDSWTAGLQAIKSRTARDIDLAVKVCTEAAVVAPGLAVNAIMLFSYLGRLNDAYNVAHGLFEGTGDVIQRPRQMEGGSLYSEPSWGRTQGLFVPASANFRNDERFAGLCDRLGLSAYWRKRGIWPDQFVLGSLAPE